MSRRPLASAAALALLGGCALAYQHDDYRDRGQGGGAGTTTINTMMATSPFAGGTRGLSVQACAGL